MVTASEFSTIYTVTDVTVWLAEQIYAGDRDRNGSAETAACDTVM